MRTSFLDAFGVDDSGADSDNDVCGVEVVCDTAGGVDANSGICISISVSICIFFSISRSERDDDDGDGDEVIESAEAIDVDD